MKKPAGSMQLVGKLVVVRPDRLLRCGLFGNVNGFAAAFTAGTMFMVVGFGKTDIDLILVGEGCTTGNVVCAAGSKWSRYMSISPQPNVTGNLQYIADLLFGGSVEVVS